MKTIISRSLVYLTLLPCLAVGESANLVVNDYQEVLRSRIAGPPSASLHRGTPMQIVERNGDWIKVQVEGWIRQDRVNAMSPNASQRHSNTPAINPGELLKPTLLDKGYSAEGLHQMIWVNVEFDTSNLPKPTRAIKGALVISDLFNDPMMRIYWTINEPLSGDKNYRENGTNFAYNEFLSHHQWLRLTDKQDMKVSFEVSDIIYQDGEQMSWYH